jgi:hypothetical protein
MICESLFCIPATLMFSYINMTEGDEPGSTSHTTSAATTTATTTTTSRSQRAPNFPAPDAEGDPESGFSQEWISNHEENAARRQREVREALGGHQWVLDYRTSSQQQQQMEIEIEERECRHRCTYSVTCVRLSKYTDLGTTCKMCFCIMLLVILFHLLHIFVKCSQCLILIIHTSLPV